MTLDQVAYDFSLKRAVIEVDRDADRRWSFATDKMKLAEDKDAVAPNSAPLEDFKWENCSKWWFTSMAQSGRPESERLEIFGAFKMPSYLS